MTSPSELPQVAADAKVYRLRRHYLILGIVCTTFFAGVGVTSTVAAYLNIDGSFPHPRIYEWLFGMFWSIFTLMGVWVIAAYYRERLILALPTMIQRCIFGSKTLNIGDICQIKWRPQPQGGSIQVRTQSQKVTIYLGNFTDDERDEITLYFRRWVADEVQENWPQFEAYLHRLAAARRDLTRREYILMAIFAVMLLAVIVGGIYCKIKGIELSL